MPFDIFVIILLTNGRILHLHKKITILKYIVNELSLIQIMRLLITEKYTLILQNEDNTYDISLFTLFLYFYVHFGSYTCSRTELIITYIIVNIPRNFPKKILLSRFQFIYCSYQMAFNVPNIVN